MKILIFLTILFISSPSWATNWYVRDGGGSVYGTSQATNTCNGLTNTVYSFGASPNCALNHPSFVMGAGENGGGSTALWVGGDTLYVDGDSDITPGAQAQYAIGYGMPNASGCSSGDPYNCWLVNIPAGSSGTPTQLIGTGTHKPQFYGSTATYNMLTAENNYITIQWLEVTDHEACAKNDPQQACDSIPGSPNAPWGDRGILLSGNNLTLTDVYVHGLGLYGIITGAIGNSTFTRLWVIGNGFGGMIVGNDGNESVTGTLTFNQPIVEWNGCVEAYPLTGGIDNPSNYTNCWGENSGGYGDGLAFGATQSENPGNWNVYGPGSIAWNTQDGLDLLHGSISGNTINVDKMRFEGNAGQQIKVTAQFMNLTNSLIVGDCGWWQNAAQSLSGGMQNGDSCRANGDLVLFSINSGTVDNIYNNTIYSNGSIALESGEDTTCDGTTFIYAYNNIIQGGYWWNDDTTWNGAGGNALSAYWYNDGSDGDGAGPCGSQAWTEDYNIVINTKNSNSGCNGAHDKCGTSPGFISSLPTGTAGGGESTYYNAWSGITYAPITSGSAANNAGKTGLSFWNNSNDYYNVVRSTPSIGGLQYQSCASGNFDPCFFNTDCCSNVCSGNVCTTIPSSSPATVSAYGNVQMYGNVSL